MYQYAEIGFQANWKKTIKDDAHHDDDDYDNNQ